MRKIRPATSSDKDTKRAEGGKQKAMKQDAARIYNPMYYCITVNAKIQNMNRLDKTVRNGKTDTAPKESWKT